jgi:hypothetical protein
MLRNDLYILTRFSNGNEGYGGLRLWAGDALGDPHKIHNNFPQTALRFNNGYNAMHSRQN